MWICTKFQEIIEDIESINRKSRAKSIEMFDFSTLYTKFDIKCLNENMKWCIERAFHKKKEKIAVYERNASFVLNPRETTYAYDVQECIQLNNALVENAYFKVGDYVFKQIIGIAMGSDPAPFQANLGLYYYEFAFQNAYKNGSVARKLNHTQRYIDDINTKNDDGAFASNIKKHISTRIRNKQRK